ncbi:heme-copper oxidase family protein [Cohnella cholangitidis]|uniref:Cbb3-type cytochrome c oxidase subunit I n=1 Tax=Cohnella cholangitidis TaxID=2598458 RepID=A0A7G5C5N2_9BACL|nr:hypothetical protein [Cohnella cholangitidis]QMV44516.1 hypothetical protein FPL14_27605 [Cohnella cholangitidis]
MSRLPFLFIVTGMIGFVVFHATSLFSLFDWMNTDLRGPTGWFQIHLFVLGWATMLAMGAVYQLINVILQSNVYSERLGYAHYFAFAVGLSGLLYGFKRAETEWIAGFATLALAGILLFVWNIAVTLFRASKWNPVTVSAACSVLYLALTGLSGMAMGLNLAFGNWNGIHEQLFHAHIWLGTIGWFGLLITGFSYKMLPMFYLSHHYPTKLQTVVLFLWNAAVVVGTISFLVDGNDWSIGLALALLVMAIIAYNAHLIQIKKSRHKRNPGSGIRWSMYGNQAFAVMASAMLILTLVYHEQWLNAKTVLVAGWIYLAGWVSFTILCYASKIVPFLWWTRKYGKHAGKPGAPVMADLLNENKVNVGLAAIACSSLLLLTGLAADARIIVAIGGTAFSLFSIGYISLIGLVFKR